MSNENNTEVKTGANGSGTEDNQMQKKFDDFSSSFTKKLDALFAKLDSVPARQVVQTPANEPDLESLMITDPKAAAALIKEQAKKEILGEVGKQTRAQQEFNNSFSSLSQDYPEILSASSQLYVRAKELLGQYSKGENDAEALERAVFKAANELGVVPMKARKSSSTSDDDSFSGSGSGTEGNRGNRRDRKQKDDELSPETLAFAQMLGKNVSDPKYLEKLKEISKKRTGNWNKYK